MLLVLCNFVVGCLKVFVLMLCFNCVGFMDAFLLCLSVLRLLLLQYCCLLVARVFLICLVCSCVVGFFSEVWFSCKFYTLGFPCVGLVCS